MTIDWQDPDIESTISPLSPLRHGRIVPCYRRIVDEDAGRVVGTPGSLLTVDEALQWGLISEADAEGWREELRVSLERGLRR